MLTIAGWLTIAWVEPSVHSLLRITSVQTTAVRVPLREPLKWTGGIRESASGLRVTEVFMMPHHSEAATDLKMVDVHFMKIGVDVAKAEARREELIDLLNCWDGNDLSGGPSYISIGGDLGSQSLALDLFALGEALGLWKVLTLGIPEGDDRGDELAGKGFVFMSGYPRK